MKKMWKKIFKKIKMSVLGFVIIVLLLILVIFADLYVGYDKVLAQDVKNKIAIPFSESYLRGQIILEEILFARLIYGSKSISWNRSSCHICRNDDRMYFRSCLCIYWRKYLIMQSCVF